MIVERERVVAALPGYSLGRQLGVGAFGLVLAGEHRQMRRPVAIKVMSAESAEGGRVDFAAEARMLAKLDHPHVVRVFNYVEAEGLCLVVMELLAGGTLTRRRAGMGPQQACAVGLAVAAALEHAHGRGVLHRDIKADNILFAADGTPKVGDFGIAKLFDGSATASQVAGTPMYMAPEQIQGGRLTAATDLYALGVVLYRLLTGSPPFDPTLPLQALWHQHLNDPPPPMLGVPDRLAAVVLRLLAKVPANRHPDADAFALDLARAATATYGRGWHTRTGLPLNLDDVIRRAATIPSRLSDGDTMVSATSPTPLQGPRSSQAVLLVREPTEDDGARGRHVGGVDPPDTPPDLKLPARPVRLSASHQPYADDSQGFSALLICFLLLVFIVAGYLGLISALRN